MSLESNEWYEKGLADGKKQIRELRKDCRRDILRVEKKWMNRLRKIEAECTTDWGTTDFEMFAEKVLAFIPDKPEGA